jgi:hypothetical protein
MVKDTRWLGSGTSWTEGFGLGMRARCKLAVGGSLAFWALFTYLFE